MSDLKLFCTHRLPPYTPIPTIMQYPENVNVMNYQIDVLLITALKIEYDAARDAAISKTQSGNGVVSWTERSVDLGIPFLFGEYSIEGRRSISVALARPTRMGANTTGPLAGTLVGQLRPSCLAMCGVCAGNPEDLALGDVIVADMVYQYDEGKLTVEGFEGDHHQTSQHETWIRAAQDLEVDDLPSYGPAAEGDANLWLLERLYAGGDPLKHPARQRYFPPGTWKERVENLEFRKLLRRVGKNFEITEIGRCLVEEKLAYNIDAPRQLPFAVRVGPIASGNVVVKDAVTWDALKAMGVRSILGLEMEAAVIGGTADRLGVPNWIVAKGVMDHADPKKDDRYKPFAARASAEVLFKILEQKIAKGERSQALVEPNAVVAGIPKFFGQHGSKLSDIENALNKASSSVARMLNLAKVTAERAFENAQKATELAALIRRDVGPQILKARGSGRRREKVIIRGSRVGTGPSTGAVVWNSGDEYCGELQGDAEYGLGVYKVYLVSADATPNSVASFSGLMENGHYGPSGVYRFPNGSLFSGDWIDKHPRFGYREFLDYDCEFDFYFGHFSTSPSRAGTRWLPHGQGVGIRLKESELVYGEFLDGQAYPRASYRLTF